MGWHLGRLDEAFSKVLGIRRVAETGRIHCARLAAEGVVVTLKLIRSTISSPTRRNAAIHFGFVTKRLTHGGAALGLDRRSCHPGITLGRRHARALRTADRACLGRNDDQCLHRSLPALPVQRLRTIHLRQREQHLYSVDGPMELPALEPRPAAQVFEVVANIRWRQFGKAGIRMDGGVLLGARRRRAVNQWLDD
jgi:hypothetical protein